MIPPYLEYIQNAPIDVDLTKEEDIIEEDIFPVKPDDLDKIESYNYFFTELDLN